MVKPFVVAVQRVPAERQQKQAQSWYHHHTLAPVAVMLIQASLLLDAAPTATIIAINLYSLKQTNMVNTPIDNY